MKARSMPRSTSSAPLVAPTRQFAAMHGFDRTRADKLLCRQVLRRAYDIEIRERKLVRRIVFVADYPGLNEDILDTKRRDHPRCIGRDELRHLAQQLRTFGRIGHRPRLLVEVV